MIGNLLNQLLRDPEATLERPHASGEQRQLVAALLVTILLGAAMFGGVVGSFRGHQQLLLAALKLPLATMAALMLSAPILLSLSAVFGNPWSLQRAVFIVLSAGARSSIVLAALAPLLWLMLDFGAGYYTLKLVAVAAYGLAGLSALSYLVRGLRSAAKSGSVLVLFSLCFLVVAAQSAWLFRPYLGDPRDENVPAIAWRNEGGLIGALWDALPGVAR